MPAFFLLSGAYIDTQSHRYLIPWYAGLSVAWAVGSVVLAREREAIATVDHRPRFLPCMRGSRLLWYQKLQPDTQSLATLECLKRNGLRGGYAEYWTAYKLTFLAQESIVVAPTDGDRSISEIHGVRALAPR